MKGGGIGRPVISWALNDQKHLKIYKKLTKKNPRKNQNIMK